MFKHHLDCRVVIIPRLACNAGVQVVVEVHAVVRRQQRSAMRSSAGFLEKPEAFI